MSSSKSKSSSYNTTDVIIGMVMAVAVVAAAIVVFNNQDNVLTSQKGNSQSRRMLLQTPQEELDYIRSVLANNSATTSHATKLPASAAELAGVEDQVDEDPVKRAAAWLINKDTLNDEYTTIRFALAVVYYNNNGDQWTNSENWLSAESNHCDWHGVGCCTKFLATPSCANVDTNIVMELDLYMNNVSGDIHDVIALLTDLRSVFLSKNQMTGTINANAFGSLRKLLKLYLQHNKLTGTIPANIRDVNKIDTMYLQGNDLTGSWPTELCGRCSSCPGGVEYFGVDCEEVVCPETCCNHWEHCYYGNSNSS